LILFCKSNIRFFWKRLVKFEMRKHYFDRVDLSHILTNRLLLSIRAITLLTITTVLYMNIVKLFVPIWTFSLDGRCPSLVRLGLPVDYLIGVPIALLFLTDLGSLILSAPIFHLGKL
jgi:hypothetical protein